MGKIYQFMVTATPTIDTNIYASGDLIGDKMTFTFPDKWKDHPTGSVFGVDILDKDKQGVNVTLILFSTNPTNSTFTNNAALAIHATDLPYATVKIPITSHVSFSANGISYSDNIKKLLQGTPDGLVYGVIQSNGTPTYTTTTSLTVRLFVEADQSN